jgi:hypothetical protein
MKSFMLGFMSAATLLIGLYFFTQSVFLPAKLGRALDEDIVYLKSGDIVRGWIKEERGGIIFIETEKAAYSLPREKCNFIYKDVLGRYLRELR